MHITNRIATYALLCAAGSAGAFIQPAGAQAVVAAWGNVEGLRVEGEQFAFETSLCSVSDAGVLGARTGKERQRPRFTRNGTQRSITTQLGALSITETVDDVGPREARVEVQFRADSATGAQGFLCIDAPRSQYAVARVIDAGSAPAGTPALEVRSGNGPAFAARYGRGVSFERGAGASPRRVEISASEPVQVLVGTSRADGQEMHRVLIPILTGRSEQGKTAKATFTLRAVGPVDRTPVTLAIDASKPGRVFEGLGGNFRIQNRRVDPKVIAYNLENLRVAWARVEMPWRAWHPDTLVDPSTKDSTQHDLGVHLAMSMARTAAAKGAPVIVSAWFPPQWAALGPLPRGGQRVNGQWGNALDPAKTERIYESLTSYLLYLKKHYGVEAVMFSFNESDLGIDVRQTAQEHADLIKGLGAYMKAKGLKTTMLLGDVSDATPIGFIEPAMKDSTTWPYIGAVSYHSWRGWSDSLLTFWSDAAKKLKVPLLVGEGSTDAGAHRYPQIFLEPEFALQEIELYVRMLALSEPLSILQWQLTSDYSLLAGGGVYGDTTALRPTQRFWNLKQLASTPERVAHLPMKCAGPVRCAALFNAQERTFAAHLVNTGASRVATITGIPRGVTSLRVWTTDAQRTMQEGTRVPVQGGRARVSLGGASYVTLVGR